MRRFSRGDTIIEVMFSFTVLSILVVSTYVVMNRGTQIAQRSLEITLVRQQIDSQISLIRYAQANNTEAWQNIRANYVVPSEVIINPTSFVEANSRCPTVAQNDITAGRKSFFLAQNPNNNDVRLINVDSSSYGEPQVYSQVDYRDSANPRSYGVFVQVTKAEKNTNVGVVGDSFDVYVSTCWDSVGTSVPSTIGTITRIYDGTR